MLPFATTLATSMMERILHGGILVILFHLLFVASIVAASVSLFRRVALPWTLFLAAIPFACASAAAYFLLVGTLMIIGSSGTPILEELETYVYSRELFRSGWMSSAVLAIIAFVKHQKSLPSPPQPPPQNPVSEPPPAAGGYNY